MKTFRPERVSDLIIEELNKLIMKEVEVPDTLITITDVEVVKDLSRAVVKVSVYPTEQSEKVLKILKKLQGHFQYLLLRRMNIRPMPKIAFEADYGLEKAARVEKRLLENK
ncbi:MAG: 30S ribosome-binding factor RbfA [Patescibacteria group bacterium]